MTPRGPVPSPIGTRSLLARRCGGDGSVVVAVVAVRVVQVAVHKVVHMVAVGDRLVTAAGAVLVARLMSAAVMARRTGVRVDRADGEDVLVHMVAVHIMQVS